MAVIKNMMVRAGADFSAFTTQAKRASNSMRGMRQSVSQSCSGMKAALAGVKSALGVLGVGLSVSALISGVREATEAYDEQSVAEMKLATAMRNSMGARNAEIQSVLDLCSAQQELGVISADTQTAGAQELATYLKYPSSLRKLIPVMNDLAAQQYRLKASAEQVTGVATMLGKVMNGQVGALSRYGYSFSEAEEQILKYGSEAQRAAVLSQVVERSVGGMNRALAATPAGQMQQLSNALDDTRAKGGECARAFGVLLLPVLWQVNNALAGAAAWAQRAVNSMRKAAGLPAAMSDWERVSVGVSDVGDAWDDVSKSVTGAATAAKEARRQLFGFDDLNILNDTDSRVSGGSGNVAAAGWSENPAAALPEMDVSAQATAWADMAEGMSQVSQAGEDLPRLTATLIAFKDVWDGIKNTDWSWSAIWQDLKDGAGGIADTFRMIGADIGDWLRELPAKASSKISAMSNGTQQSLRFMAGGIAGILGGVSQSFARLGTDADALGRRIKGKTTEIKESVVKGFRDMGTGISEGWKKVRESIKLPHFTWSWQQVGKYIPIPKVSVSWYARGGVFDRPSLVGLGENGREAVVPLERNTGWITQVARQLSERMQGQAAGFGSAGGGYPFAAAVRSAGSPNNDVVAALYTVTGELLGAMEDIARNRGDTVLKIGEMEVARATAGARRSVDKAQGMSLIKNFA